VQKKKVLKKRNPLAQALQQKVYQQKVIPNKKNYNRKKLKPISQE